jgi:hypothetical protein
MSSKIGHFFHVKKYDVIMKCDNEDKKDAASVTDVLLKNFGLASLK